LGSRLRASFISASDSTSFDVGDRSNPRQPPAAAGHAPNELACLPREAAGRLLGRAPQAALSRCRDIQRSRHPRRADRAPRARAGPLDAATAATRSTRIRRDRPQTDASGVGNLRSLAFRSSAVGSGAGSASRSESGGRGRLLRPPTCSAGVALAAPAAGGPVADIVESSSERLVSLSPPLSAAGQRCVGQRPAVF